MDFDDPNGTRFRAPLRGRRSARPALMQDNRARRILWSQTIRKEARGLEDFDLGEVHAIAPHYVKTKKGVVRRRTFYLPREMAEAFDGSTLWFRLAPEQAEEFRTVRPPTEEELARRYLRESLRDLDDWV